MARVKGMPSLLPKSPAYQHFKNSDKTTEKKSSNVNKRWQIQKLTISLPDIYDQLSHDLNVSQKLCRSKYTLYIMVGSILFGTFLG